MRVLAALIGLAAGPVFAGAAFAGACSQTALDIRGPWGQAHFTVEIADTEAERARGLMGRKHLAASAGMLFVYDSAQPAAFWMKNTLIPLDMLFADPQGRITRVHSNAIPQDLTPIDGGDGVLVVLEINGGLAKRLGIAEGSQIRSARIDPASAAWPCD